MAKIGLISICLAAILMSLAFVVGLGYGLYLLGVVGLAFGPAAWAGFVVWAKFFFGGLILYIVGLVVAATNK